MDIKVTTKRLTTPVLPPERQFRLDLILTLHQANYSNKAIAEILNINGILSPKMNEYSQKLIWATLKKYKARQVRESDSIVDFDMPFFLVPNYPRYRKLVN